MEQVLLNIGFSSTVVLDRVVAIVSSNSAPMKRLKDEAREDRRLIDATHGRRTRSIIILDSNHIVLSAVQAETISQRYAQLRESADGGALQRFSFSLNSPSIVAGTQRFCPFGDYQGSTVQRFNGRIILFQP